MSKVNVKELRKRIFKGKKDTTITEAIENDIKDDGGV
jgi:hypothetical protein